MAEGLEGLLKMGPKSKSEPPPAEGGQALAARDALLSAKTEDEAREAFELLMSCCSKE